MKSIIKASLTRSFDPASNGWSMYSRRQKEPWDFSRKKSQAVFVRDDKIVIRPITPKNEEFYRSIRTQYSIMYKSACDAAKEKGGNLFISEISPPEEFYCIIEKDDVPAGYLIGPTCSMEESHDTDHSGFSFP